MITYQEEVYKEPNLCYGNLVKKAIDVFGSDYVEVEQKRRDRNEYTSLNETSSKLTKRYVKK